MAIKNILFDLDGTLTNPYLGITNCIKYALAKLEVQGPDDLRWCIGPPLLESFELLLKSYPKKSASEGVRLYRERFATLGMFENEVYEGIPEVLAGLVGTDFQIFVATSKPHVYAKQIVEHFGLDRFFKHVYGSELDGTRSQKTALISHVLKLEGLAPADTIMIGDRMHDLIGAQQNGLRSMGVTWGYGDREELQAQNPEVLCDSPVELAKYFQLA